MKPLLLAAATVGLGLVALPSGAVAQSDNPGAITVFGTDPCPRATDDQVVICRRLPESMRYRLPEAYRSDPNDPTNRPWANKARELKDLGATGTDSCSAVGPGGFTGCLTQQIKQARREQREDADTLNPPE